MKSPLLSLRKGSLGLLSIAALLVCANQSFAQFSLFGFGQSGPGYTSGGYSNQRNGGGYQAQNRSSGPRVAQRNYQSRYNQVMRNPRGNQTHYLAQQDPAPKKIALAQPKAIAPERPKLPTGVNQKPESVEATLTPYPEAQIYEHGFGCQGPDCDGGCPTCVGPQLPWYIFQSPVFENFSFHSGMHGFKGPVDQGVNGNFGIHAGFNIGIPISYPLGIGAQVGARVSQSNLNGSTFESDDRNQTFVTGGFFRRTDCGLQYGIAFDYMKDEYYVDYEVQQTRLEMSWVRAGGGEWGVWAALNSSSQDVAITPHGTTSLRDFTFTSVDQFNFFYRRKLENCGEIKLWAGFTNRKDGIVGGDLEIPLTDRLAFQTTVNYLIPEEGKNNRGFVNESWGMMVNLVWYPGCRARGQQCNPFKPLFDVGSNATLFTDSFQAN